MAICQLSRRSVDRPRSRAWTDLPIQLMHFKGHNGRTPCCWCEIAAVPFIRTLPPRPSDVPPTTTGSATQTNTMPPEPGLSALREAVQPNSSIVSPSVPPVKEKSKTTYYPARKPHDLPASVAAIHNVGDIDYSNLPLRNDDNVKGKVGHIQEAGISAAERERRATAAGISGNVSSLTGYETLVLMRMFISSHSRFCILSDLSTFLRLSLSM